MFSVSSCVPLDKFSSLTAVPDAITPIILAEMCDYKLAFVPNHTINSLNTIEDKETSKSYILDILDEELQSKIEDYKIAKVDEMMSAMQAYIKTLSPEQIEKLFSHDNDDPKK